MCALVAGQRGRSVALLEHNDRVGRKIAISGGGRCNFTNLGAGPGNYLSGNPDFCRSALARFTPWDFLALVEKHGIRYHEKKLGQQFCDTSSREIIELLLAECANGGVEIVTNARVHSIQRLEQFAIKTSEADYACDSLVVATGGLSFPKLGATSFGHDLARQFGIDVIAPRPGLVPLTWTPSELARWKSLAGLSLPVVAKTGPASFHESLLFTHRGLSGPAILQISSFWKPGQPISFDLLPDHPGESWLGASRQSGETIRQVLSRLWPQRFAEEWTRHHAVEKPLGHCRNPEIAAVTQCLHAWSPDLQGTEGYPKAEVTLGGVNTSELSSKTMESRKVSGLYFIGEVVDVTGWLGGYNFQWAWASGHAAGQVV
ncbi:aminoacetone oxidase family FAD-binding enzyme [Spartobacteria bacterium LR76]|nr:aminoacetone oxidase family FAD-binding enzyme [Spartobacteria bacterium LR76]